MCILYNTKNNLVPLYLIWFGSSENDIDLSILLKKNFLPNFVEGKYQRFERNVSQEKAPTPAG